MKMLLQGLILSAIPFAAFARTVPEPESLSLIAIGAVGLVIALSRKRK